MSCFHMHDLHTLSLHLTPQKFFFFFLLQNMPASIIFQKMCNCKNTMPRFKGWGLNCILILSPLCVMTQLPNTQWKSQTSPSIRFQLKQHVLQDKQPWLCHVAVQSIHLPIKKRHLCLVTICTYWHITLDEFLMILVWKKRFWPAKRKA